MMETLAWLHHFFKMEACADQTGVTPQLFVVEMTVPSQKSERICMFVFLCVFSIGFWNCSDSVVFIVSLGFYFVFFFILVYFYLFNFFGILLHEFIWMIQP